jgi:hypothetical protein
VHAFEAFRLEIRGLAARYGVEVEELRIETIRSSRPKSM